MIVAGPTIIWNRLHGVLTQKFLQVIVTKDCHKSEANATKNKEINNKIKNISNLEAVA